MGLGILIQAVVLLYSISGFSGSEWSYEGATGPDNWAQLFPKDCAGKRQSPVNIVTNDVHCLSPSVIFYYKPITVLIPGVTSAKIANNGHTAQAGGVSLKGQLHTFFDNVDARYDFLQCHFHWGPNSSVGSEHTVNGKHYPLEMHFVHTNAKYSGTPKYLTAKDGIAVVGMFFQISPEDNDKMKPIINALKYIQIAGSTRSLITDLKSLLPLNLMGYHYKGSLTTPSCNEVVDWIVLTHSMPISEKQMKEFRLLRQGNATSPYITSNYRPTQPLNDRQICSTYGMTK